MNVRVQLDKLSQPIVYRRVLATYQKGDLYCILRKVKGVRVVDKFPVRNLFRIEESY
jgi:hypothetical protein